jgi:hypothetical protein
MFSLSVRIEPNRVIEINHLGRFYVLGVPTFSTMFVPDFIDKAREGWIVVERDTSLVCDSPLGNNKLFKMTNDGRLIPALFKSQEMAEEVCYACNRIRI